MSYIFDPIIYKRLAATESETSRELAATSMRLCLMQMLHAGIIEQWQHDWELDHIDISLAEAKYPPKFTFDEVVIVRSENPALKTLNGRKAKVVGRAFDNAKWGYAVMYRGTAWSVEESELESHARPEKNRQDDRATAPSVEAVAGPAPGSAGQ